MKSLSWSPDESRSPCWLSRSWGWPKIFPWKPPKRSSKREATLTTFRKRCSECFGNVLMRSETIETSTCWTPTTSRTTPVGVQAAGKTKRKWLVPTCYLWLIGAKCRRCHCSRTWKGKSEWRMPWRPWLEPISHRCWHHDTMGSLLCCEIIIQTDGFKSSKMCIHLSNPEILEYPAVSLFSTWRW